MTDGTRGILTLFLLAACIFLQGCQARSALEWEVEYLQSELAGSADTFEYAFNGIAWLGGDLVVESSGGNRRNVGVSAQRLWVLDAEEATPINLGIEEKVHLEDCDNVSVGSPEALPDGRLGFVASCTDFYLPVWLHYWFAFDRDAGLVERLLPQELPSWSDGSVDYSWNDDVTRVVASTGNLLVEQIYVADAEGASTLDLGFTIAKGARRSPDDQSIGFFGTTDTREGPDILDSEFGLYLYDVDSTALRIVSEGIYSPRGMDWLDGGRWVVFSGQVGRLPSSSGLWLLDISSGSTYRIVSGLYGTPRASLDGLRIAAVHSTNVWGAAFDLAVVSVGELPEPRRP